MGQNKINSEHLWYHQMMEVPRMRMLYSAPSRLETLGCTLQWHLLMILTSSSRKRMILRKLRRRTKFRKSSQVNMKLERMIKTKRSTRLPRLSQLIRPMIFQTWAAKVSTLSSSSKLTKTEMKLISLSLLHKLRIPCLLTNTRLSPSSITITRLTASTTSLINATSMSTKKASFVPWMVKR